MKLEVLNPQLETQARPGARTMELNLRGAWLRELERAQLDDWFRIRVTPEAGMAPPLNPGGPAAVSVEPASRATAPGIDGPASAASVVRQGCEAGARFAPAETSADPEPAPPGSGAAASERTRAGASRTPASVSDESTAAPGAADRVASRPLSPTPWAVQAHASAAQDAAETGWSKKVPAESASAGADVVPRSRQWPARSVHMMAEGTGARVWIRDSGLTRSSIGGILSALTGELALRGLRLRALFVNGRSAFNAEPAPGSETHKMSVGGDTGGSGSTSRSISLKR